MITPANTELILHKSMTYKETSRWKDRAVQLRGGKVVQLRQMPEFKHVKTVIFPDDNLYEWWTHIITLWLLYTATVTPYRVALIDSDTLEWEVIDYIIDVFFFLDVVCNCFLAFYDARMNLVTSKKVIVLNYMQSWMLPDTLACIPLQVIMNSQGANTLIRLSKLPKICRFLKLAKLFRVLKVVKNRNRLMRHVHSILRVSISVERLLWFVLWLMLFLHLFTCAWVFIGTYDVDQSDNWILCRGFQDYGNFDLYLVGLYFSITTLATVGYGDITACNNTERMVCAAMMLIGIFVYSYTIGSLTSLIGNLDHRKAKLDAKMELLMDLANQYKLSKPFMQKLSLAIEYEHRNNKDDVNTLVDNLPSSLRTQLLILIYQNMIESNVFFEDKSEDFAAWVAPFLFPLMLPIDEFVYKQDDAATDMYFLIKGQVDYVIITETEDVPFQTVKEREYFGEEDFLFSLTSNHIFSSKSVSKSEFLALAREHFDEMMSKFEKEAIEIKTLATVRKRKLDECREQVRGMYLSKPMINGVLTNKLRVLPPDPPSQPELNKDCDTSSEDEKQSVAINLLRPQSSSDSPEDLETDFKGRRPMLRSILKAERGKKENAGKIDRFERRLRELERSQREMKTIMFAIAAHLGVAQESLYAGQLGVVSETQRSGAEAGEKSEGSYLSACLNSETST